MGLPKSRKIPLGMHLTLEDDRGDRYFFTHNKGDLLEEISKIAVDRESFFRKFLTHHCQSSSGLK